MQIVRHRPITRGVTELMYVGDDEAVEKAVGDFPQPLTTVVVGAAAVGVAMMLFGKKKKTKLAGFVATIPLIAATAI